MKKNSIILVLVIILAAVAVWIVSTNTKSTIKRELRDFAISDTAAIDKIFMVQKNTNQVLLNRTESGWLVNDKYAARIDAVQMILKTLKRVQVRNPVSDSSMDNVIKMLATRNTKVEIYSKGKLLKTIYVGGPTQDQLGTYMMLEGSSVPFIVAIPGFAGYLSSRFFTEERDWRSPLVFAYDFENIASIKSIYSDFPDQSFLIEKADNGFDISSLNGNIKAPAIDSMALRYFVSKFEKVACEYFKDQMDIDMVDSLNSAKPFRVLEVADTEGRTKKVEAHVRRAIGLLDESGNPLEWDNERLYARIDGETWVVIQFYVFNALFKEFDYFFPPGR